MVITHVGAVIFFHEKVSSLVRYLGFFPSLSSAVTHTIYPNQIQWRFHVVVESTNACLESSPYSVNLAMKWYWFWLLLPCRTWSSMLIAAVFRGLTHCCCQFPSPISPKSISTLKHRKGPDIPVYFFSSQAIYSFTYYIYLYIFEASLLFFL